jgi:hypothetical protein
VQPAGEQGIQSRTEPSGVHVRTGSAVSEHTVGSGPSPGFHLLGVGNRLPIVPPQEDVVVLMLNQTAREAQTILNGSHRLKIAVKTHLFA